MLRVPLVAAVSLLTTSAHAADCVPLSAQSTCFDADSFAAPFAPSDFATMAHARAMTKGTWTLGLDLDLAHRPVVLHAPSPDPAGRDVPVVRDILGGALAVAGSPLAHLELGAALPFAFYRTGTGLSAVASQTGPELPRAALRDVRVGAGYDVFDSGLAARGARFSGIVRLDLSMPTGRSSAFAGERSVVGQPAFAVAVSGGRLFAELEERVLLREPVTFGAQVLGSQWVSALGVGYDVLAPEKLRISLEARVAPYLSSRDATLPDGTRVRTDVLAPAEWMLSARTRLDALWLSLGVGTAIPFSSDQRVSPSGKTTSDDFAAVTSPAFRLVFSARYVLDAGSNR